MSTGIDFISLQPLILLYVLMGVYVGFRWCLVAMSMCVTDQRGFPVVVFMFLAPLRPPPVPHPGRLSGVVVTETLSRPRARPVPEQQLARQGEEGKDGECVCPTVLHHYLSVCLSISMS